MDTASTRTTLASTLFSIYAWSVFGLVLGLALPVIVLALVTTSRMTAFRLGSAVFKLAMRAVGVRLTLEGRENARLWEPHVLMGNHVSFLDAFVLPAVLPFPTVALEKRENFKIPVYGWFMRRWGNVPIDRGSHKQAILDLKEAAAQLASPADSWLVVMPEGTRTRDGLLGPFKKGGFRLALETGAPIVPYSLVGAYDVQRTGNWRIFPGHIKMVLHPPVDPAAFGTDGLDRLMDAVRERIENGLSPSASPSRSEAEVQEGFEGELSASNAAYDRCST